MDLPVRISDAPAGWEETQDKREEAGKGEVRGVLGLERGMKRGSREKKYHLFFRHGRGR